MRTLTRFRTLIAVVATVLPVNSSPAGEKSLGVQFRPGGDRPGVEVLAVSLGGVAERAGVRTGDRLVAIEGVPTSAKTITGQLAACRRTADIAIERNGHPLTLTCDWGTPTSSSSGPVFLNEAHSHAYRLAVPPGWICERFLDRRLGPRVVLRRGDPKVTVALVVISEPVLTSIDEKALELLGRVFGSSFDDVISRGRRVEWHQGKPAGWLEFEGTVRQERARVRQVVVRHDGRTFILTATASPNDWAAALPYADAILANLELVEPPPLRVDASATMGYRLFAHDVWMDADVQKTAPGFEGSLLVRQDRKASFRVLTKDLGGELELSQQLLDKLEKEYRSQFDGFRLYEKGFRTVGGLRAGFLEFSGVQTSDRRAGELRKQLFVTFHRERFVLVVAESVADDWSAARPELDLLLVNLQFTGSADPDEAAE